ncbi:MAG: flagellar biosynthetic protein FliO [candidate division Zixibacteria bacterium]|nr:flagellar biosynthetic protein FliO [candidate division Zixibacteria bacterium]
MNIPQLFRRAAASAVSVAATVATACAQQPTTAPAKDPLPSLTSFGTGELWSSLGRLGLTLALVIGLIWATLWVARRFLKGKVTGRGEAGLKVRERLFLAPKKSIEVVTIGDRVLVLGVTENQISMLTELTPADLAPAPNSVAARTTLSQTQEQRQRDLLRQARTRMQDLFRSARVTPMGSPPAA